MTERFAHEELVSPHRERARNTKKWNTYGPEVLPLWVAEMDFSAAPAIIAALTSALDRQEFGYPLDDQHSGLPEAYCDWALFNHGWAPQVDRVHVLPDVLVGVGLAIDQYSPVGAPVIVPTPAYMPFFQVPGVTGREVIEVPMVSDDGKWVLDLEGIDNAFAQGAGTLILCQPYNPLGRLFSRDELVALSEVVDRHGARVASDEIHAPLTFDTPHVPYASVNAATASHTVTTTSASKAWNLPGLKCAEVYTSNDKDEETWQRLSFLRTEGASTFGIRANIAAFQEGREWLAQTVGRIDANRKLLAELLSAHLPDVRYTPPEATYLAWLDFRALNLPEEPADFFIREAKIAMNAGHAFGGHGAGHTRLNLATSSAILEEAVEGMATAVANIRR